MRLQRGFKLPAIHYSCALSISVGSKNCPLLPPCLLCCPSGLHLLSKPSPPRTEFAFWAHCIVMTCLQACLHYKVCESKKTALSDLVSYLVTSKGLTYRKCSINQRTKLLTLWSICIGNWDFSGFNFERDIPRTEWKIHEMLRSWPYSWDMFWAQQLSGVQVSLKSSTKGLNNCSKRRLIKVILAYHIRKGHCF